MPFERKGRFFPETHWSQLLELGDPAHPAYAPRLDHLIHQYWMPVYHYVRSLRPVSVSEAEDLTQQFFTTLMNRGSLAKLVPERGSFRGFLKTSLRNFLIDQDRSAAARSPREGARFFPFDQAEASWKDARTGAAAPEPEDAFDREWARGVLMDAVASLRRALQAEGKEIYFSVFSEVWNEGAADASYAALARKYDLHENDVANYLRVVRQRLRSVLNDIVSGYLGPGDDPEDEVRFILSR